MVLCPVALAVGCRKCPVFSVCPLKSSIGDYVPAAAEAVEVAAAVPRRKPAAKKVAAKKPVQAEPRRRSRRRD